MTMETRPRPLFVRTEEDDLLRSLTLVPYVMVEHNDGYRYGTQALYPYVIDVIGGRSVTLPAPAVELTDRLYAVPRAYPAFDTDAVVRQALRWHEAARKAGQEGGPKPEPYKPARSSNRMEVDLGRWQLWDPYNGVLLPPVLPLNNPHGPGFTGYLRRYITEMRVNAARLHPNYASACQAWSEKVLEEHEMWERQERERQERREGSVPGEMLELTTGS